MRARVCIGGDAEAQRWTDQGRAMVPNRDVLVPAAGDDRGLTAP
jgi:hypothetical protein